MKCTRRRDVHVLMKAFGLPRRYRAILLTSVFVAPRWAASWIVHTTNNNCNNFSSCARTPTAVSRGSSSSSSSSSSIRSMATSSGPVWDAEAGVWVGDKAAGHEGTIPSPLWIFGYGSLCWRPEESFAGFERFDGEVVGWKRLFAQKSMDHRGTPESPGLVATLISDSDLEALGERSAGDPPSRTHGVAYLVPDDKAEQVLAGLDFREKGGYTRATVDVFPASGPPQRGEGGGVDTGSAAARAPTRAVLYTATTDNPNFSLSPLEEAADTIASAVGPSGPNCDYLFSLSEYLQKVGTPDPHLNELSDMVRSRIKA